LPTPTYSILQLQLQLPGLYIFEKGDVGVSNILYNRCVVQGCSGIGGFISCHLIYIWSVIWPQDSSQRKHHMCSSEMELILKT